MEKAKEELNGLIEPKYFDFVENHDTYYSDGIVEAEKVNSTRINYPGLECCKTKGDSLVYIKTKNEIDCLDFESKYEGETVEYWVWQTTGCCEDDFSGFILLPLLDGKRFWKVGYSC